MQYFFIYSGGGGAGDWNGLNRVWLQSMPLVLKSNILLKFGDVFFNHASSARLIKASLWNNVNNLRQWLFNNVNDNYVLNNSTLFLDSGTSKIVNHVATQHPNYTENQIITECINLINQNQIADKYADIILNSNINEAVTFDFPNSFKIRTQRTNTTTIVFSTASTQRLIQQSAIYCNQLYALLGNNQQRILTTINGLWSAAEIQQFLNLLVYQPNQIAVGGLTRANSEKFTNAVQNINQVFNLQNLQRVHFLGCGGKSNARLIRNLGFNFNHISVDNSTPFNRAIDGNTAGTSESGYFDYLNCELHRINPNSLNNILAIHQQSPNPHFSVPQMNAILQSIIQHQGRNSGPATYENRARLVIHNNDVFRVNAL